MRHLIQAWIAFQLITIAGVATPASAAPITWHLLDVTFDDGGTASGSFVFDATTSQYSSIDVITTDGTARTGAHYISSTYGGNPGLPWIVQMVTSPSRDVDLTGTPVFALFFFTLTDLGGTIPTSGWEAACDRSDCLNPDFTQSRIPSGFVTSQPVPETEPTLLLVLGLTTLSVSRAYRRRRRVRPPAGRAAADPP